MSARPTDEPVLLGEQVVLAELQNGHVTEIRRIHATPEVRRWWGTESDPEWPLELGHSSHRFAVLVNDAVRGMIQYHEETDPMYRHAGIDIFLDPTVHGRGLGRDAIATLARFLIERRGHHRLVIDPAADNTAAIRCYTAVGFRPVGVMRRYERDPDGAGWHDGLLMEMLAND